MRRIYLGITALALVTACADGPTAPSSELLAPQSASFFFMDNPPPPWAMLEGTATAANVSFSYFGALLINKPGNVAWLAFKNGGTATFSANARIMNVNGKVIGVGSFSVGSSTYDLSGITSFTVDRSCMSGSANCVTFGGGGISSTRSSWTGVLANDNFRKPGWDGPPGGGGGGGDVCYIACDGYIKGR